MIRKYTVDITATDLIVFPFTDEHPPLKIEVEQWIDENCAGPYKTYWNYDSEYPKTRMYIEFKKKNDAVAFKLRWL